MERQLEICRKRRMRLSETHAHDKCMMCNSPPTIEVVWADGRGRAWFCDEHLSKWAAEEERDIIKQRKVDGVVGKKYGMGEDILEKKQEKSSARTPHLNKYDPGSVLGWLVFVLQNEGGMDDAVQEVKRVSRVVADAWSKRKSESTEVDMSEVYSEMSDQDLQRGQTFDDPAVSERYMRALAMMKVAVKEAEQLKGMVSDIAQKKLMSDMYSDFKAAYDKHQRNLSRDDGLKLAKLWRGVYAKVMK